jgi:DNA invertase Pin-like site-specific DNA recombinase
LNPQFAKAEYRLYCASENCGFDNTSVCTIGSRKTETLLYQGFQADVREITRISAWGDLQVDTSTPMGTLILTVMAAVATLERSMINQRTQGGRKSKAENGGYAYGAPRFGAKPSGNKELVEDSYEQVTIEVIRRHRRSGKSYSQVADYLNEQSYPTKQGGKWSSSTVFAICRRLKVS